MCEQTHTVSLFGDVCVVSVLGTPGLAGHVSKGGLSFDANRLWCASPPAGVCVCVCVSVVAAAHCVRDVVCVGGQMREKHAQVCCVSKAWPVSTVREEQVLRWCVRWRSGGAALFSRVGVP